MRLFCLCKDIIIHDYHFIIYIYYPFIIFIYTRYIFILGLGRHIFHSFFLCCYEVYFIKVETKYFIVNSYNRFFMMRCFDSFNLDFIIININYCYSNIIDNNFN